MFYVILCFFTTNTRKKIVTHCVFLYFLTPWCRCARRQYWGLVLLGLFFLYILGFVVSVWWGPNSTGNPLCILRVFVFFFSYKRTNAQGNPLCILRVFVFFFSIKKNRWTGHVFCVFLYFFFRSVDTKPTCSMCFCVFLFINFYFSHNSDRGKHLMCFVCFCVFAQRSQVTPPMYFVCFCVFFFQRLVWS